MLNAILVIVVISIIGAKSGWGKTKFLNLIVSGIVVGEKKKQVLIIDPTNERAYDNTFTETLVDNVDEIGWLTSSNSGAIPLLDNSVIILRLRDDTNANKKEQLEGIINSIDKMAEDNSLDAKKFLIIDEYQSLLSMADSIGINPEFGKRLWRVIRKFSRVGDVIIATQTLKVLPKEDIIDTELYLGELPDNELGAIEPELPKKVDAIKPKTFYHVGSGSVIRAIFHNS